MDTSSLETILLHPEEILADPDAFRLNDAAHELAARWHRNTGVPLDKDGHDEKWLASLRCFAAIPVEGRAAQPAFGMLQAVKNRIPRFRDEAPPFLDTFLPRNGLRFESSIHITAGTDAFGFMTNNRIVTDVLSEHDGNDPDRIFSLVTHEAYHIGYGYSRAVRTETELDEGLVYNTMLDGLQNEGPATSVGYRARDVSDR